LANGYPHQPPPPQQGSYGYAPGPNHAPVPHSPAYNQPRYSRDGREIDEIYKGGREDERSRITPFKQGLKRNLEVWDFENHLSSVGYSPDYFALTAINFPIDIRLERRTSGLV